MDLRERRIGILRYWKQTRASPLHLALFLCVAVLALIPVLLVGALVVGVILLTLPLRLLARPGAPPRGASDPPGKGQIIDVEVTRRGD